MADGLFSSTTIPILEQVVQFAQTRHTVLAGNVANLDTPGYRVRDLAVDDFQGKLSEAIKARRSKPAYRTLDTDPAEPIGLADLAKRSSIVRHDENNVDIERQVTEMVKNQMQHNLALSVMTQQFRLLGVAISERV